MSENAVPYPTLAAAFAAKFGANLHRVSWDAADASAADHFIRAIRAAHWGDAVRPIRYAPPVGTGLRAAG